MISPPRGGVEVSMSLGASSTSTSFTSTSIFSVSTQDTVTDNKASASGTGFVGSIGFAWDMANWGGGWPFAPDYLPTGEEIFSTSPGSSSGDYSDVRSPPLITLGVDGNVYFFAGSTSTITGIPGGPFGTAAGSDSFNVRNNVMFTLGAFLTVPLTPTWTATLTGGFAELNQTVTYNCVSFCAVAPATAAFSASQDKWVPGGYIGGRLATPVRLPGLPVANIGIDYKHVFFGSYDVSLGTAATRQVNARLSPDMDVVTLRLAVPLR